MRRHADPVAIYLCHTIPVRDQIPMLRIAAIDRAKWLRVALPAAFVAAIFYGDVWIGLTIPLAVLILPLMFLVFPPTDLFRRGVVPIGALLLVAIIIPVTLQAATGHPLTGKSDAVVFLPVVYGVLTIIGFRRTGLPDRVIWRALVAGGILTGAVMIVSAVVLQGQFLIPGQDYLRTDQIFQQEKASGRPIAESTGTPTPTFDFAPSTDESTTSFYGIKELAKNALGRSNYIAVFFVFLFTVSLFRQSWWFAVIFAALAIATLSRFAIIFIGCSAVLWWLNRRNFKTTWLVGGFLLAGGVGMASLLVAADFISMPASLSSRVAYWQSGAYVDAQSPLFGMPRSEILNTFNFSVVWNPHDIILWAIAISGVIGLAFYAAYLFVAFAALYAASQSSKLWRGIFFASIATLVWSLVEVVAMTPAFDILVACLYCLARNRLRDRELTRAGRLAIRSSSPPVGAPLD